MVDKVFKRFIVDGEKQCRNDAYCAYKDANGKGGCAIGMFLPDDFTISGLPVSHVLGSILEVVQNPHLLDYLDEGLVETLGVDCNNVSKAFIEALEIDPRSTDLTFLNRLQVIHDTCLPDIDEAVAELRILCDKFNLVMPR